MNTVGSQLFVGHFAPEDVASVESRLRDCLLHVDRSSVARAGDVLVKVELAGTEQVARVTNTGR